MGSQTKVKPHTELEGRSQYVSLDTVEGIIIVNGRPQIERTDSSLSLTFESNEEFLRFVERVKEGLA